MKNRKQMMAIAGVIFAIGAIAVQAADLPAGYTEVDAIVAPRGAYIDTKYKPNQNSRTMMDVTVQGKMEYWFGVSGANYTTDAYGLLNDYDLGIYYAVDDNGGSFKATAAAANDGCVPNGRHTVGITPYSLLVDGEEWATKARMGNFQLTKNLYLFASNGSSGAVARNEQTSIICHGCTINEGGTMKRNFVPCVRTADAVAGLYDTVEGIFYENAGTGTFTTSESALPFGRTLTSGTYEITESFAFVAPLTESALKIADGATVTLKIASGESITLKGGDAVGTAGAGAGIEVPANAKLTITGLGVLNAFGGNGGNGMAGHAGDCGWIGESIYYSGAGGVGGAGGGGTCGRSTARASARTGGRRRTGWSGSGRRNSRSGCPSGRTKPARRS